MKTLCHTKSLIPITLIVFFSFFQFFYLGLWADAYRTTPPYQRFVAEAPELNTKLLELFSDHVANSKVSNIERALREEKFKKPLYEAYLIMRTYVESDWEIFR